MHGPQDVAAFGECSERCLDRWRQFPRSVGLFAGQAHAGEDLEATDQQATLPQRSDIGMETGQVDGAVARAGLQLPIQPRPRLLSHVPLPARPDLAGRWAWVGGARCATRSGGIWRRWASTAGGVTCLRLTIRDLTTTRRE